MPAASRRGSRVLVVPTWSPGAFQFNRGEQPRLEHAHACLVNLLGESLRERAPSQKRNVGRMRTAAEQDGSRTIRAPKHLRVPLGRACRAEHRGSERGRESLLVLRFGFPLDDEDGSSVSVRYVGPSGRKGATQAKLIS
jgi:hypothetical protein